MLINICNLQIIFKYSFSGYLRTQLGYFIRFISTKRYSIPINLIKKLFDLALMRYKRFLKLIIDGKVHRIPISGLRKVKDFGPLIVPGRKF